VAARMGLTDLVTVHITSSSDEWPAQLHLWISSPVASIATVRPPFSRQREAYVVLTQRRRAARRLRLDNSCRCTVPAR